MSYCTQADIELLYSKELVDLLGDQRGDGTDQAIAARVQAAIDAAQGIIDAYLTTRYALPITNPPQIIKQIAIDIVVYRLALFPLSRSEEMRARYTDAVNFLKQLATGTAALPVGVGTDGEVQAPSGSGSGSGTGQMLPNSQNFKTRILTMDTGIEVPRIRRACDCWRSDYYGARPCDCERSLRGCDPNSVLLGWPDPRPI